SSSARWRPMPYSRNSRRTWSNASATRDGSSIRSSVTAVRGSCAPGKALNSPSTSCWPRQPCEATAMTMFPGLQEIRSRLVSGDLSLPEYIAELKARHEAWNHLNAVVALDPDYIEAQVRSLERHRGSSTPGPLYGIPFTAKDNINTAALPTTACTPALLGNRPPRDAGVIRRLLDAGAILFSKTNMHELAFGITTSHGAYGAARNPYDPSLIPGGSSGGTAAAVAA